MAMLGVSMGWVKQMTSAQAKAPSVVSSIKNPVLMFTAELDSLVRPDGQITFAELVPTCSRVMVYGSFHEPLFEIDSIRQPSLTACLKWLKRDPTFEFDLKFPLVLANRFEEKKKQETSLWNAPVVLGALAFTAVAIYAMNRRKS
jgi:hypothetical protein